MAVQGRVAEQHAWRCRPASAGPARDRRQRERCSAPAPITLAPSPAPAHAASTRTAPPSSSATSRLGLLLIPGRATRVTSNPASQHLRTLF